MEYWMSLPSYEMMMIDPTMRENLLVYEPTIDPLKTKEVRAQST